MKINLEHRIDKEQYKRLDNYIEKNSTTEKDGFFPSKFLILTRKQFLQRIKERGDDVIVYGSGKDRQFIAGKSKALKGFLPTAYDIINPTTKQTKVRVKKRGTKSRL
jgi:hypothetical protein